MQKLTGAGLGVLLAWSGAAMAEEPLTYDRVNLSVSAQEEVSNDTLVAIVYVQRDAARQSEAADGVNQTMRWALETAKSAAGVKSQTLQYSTSPVYNNDKIVAWRAQQSLRLESRDQTALTKLLGTLQERLAVQSVGYDVSPQARATIEDRLIAEALGSYRKRADLVAQNLGRKGYRLVHMDVSTSGYAPQPMMHRGAMMMRAAPAEVAPPAIEAGQQTMSVSVSGTIELNPIQ